MPRVWTARWTPRDARCARWRGGGFAALAGRSRCRARASGLHEPERYRIDAVAKPRRLRTVIEQIAEVRIATPTGDLTVRVTAARLAVLHVLLGDRLPEARPPGSGVELRRGAEERRPAAAAAKDSLLVQIPIRAGESALRTSIATRCRGSRRCTSISLTAAVCSSILPSR